MTLLKPILKRAGIVMPGAQPAASEMSVGFPTELVTADFQFKADVAGIAGQWVTLSSESPPGYRVAAQEMIRIGSGDRSAGGHAQGYLTFAVYSGANTPVDGRMRIVASNRHETRQRVIFEARTEVLRSSVTANKDSLDVNKQVGLPQIGFDIMEDDLVNVQIRVDAATTILKPGTTGAEPLIRIPATRFFGA